jgi:hypothetical protein
LKRVIPFDPSPAFFHKNCTNTPRRTEKTRNKNDNRQNFFLQTHNWKRDKRQLLKQGTKMAHPTESEKHSPPHPTQQKKAHPSPKTKNTPAPEKNNKYSRKKNYNQPRFLFLPRNPLF